MIASINHVEQSDPANDYSGICYFVELEGDTCGHGLFATAMRKDAQALADAVNGWRALVERCGRAEEKVENLKAANRKLKAKIKEVGI